MSDDEYDYYQQYEEQQEGQGEENVEMMMEFENCQAEEYLRENKFEEALQAFSDIYAKATQHNIRTWKVKTLHQLLELNIKSNNFGEVKNVLQSIKENNQIEKTYEQSVKSIIKSLNSLPKETYYKFWSDIFALIKSIDEPVSQLKCLFLMLQKQIQSQNLNGSREIYQKIIEQLNRTDKLPQSSELQIKYLQILYLKLKKQDFSHKLRSLYIKLPNYEEDSSSNQAYISSIKQFISPALYQQENYVECASFLCGSFIENSKYGSNFEKNKLLLKINALVVLLSGDLMLFQDNQYNPMLHESTTGYKIQSDIQALFSLFQCFKNLDISQVIQNLIAIRLQLPAGSPYANLESKVLRQLKKQKIAQICRCYKTIKFDYVKRRVGEDSDENIKNYLFELITSGKINGVIHLEERYLEILPKPNTFYTTQLQNLNDLTRKMH